MRNDYACPGCCGSGRQECDCCGSEVDCGECDGSGLDDEKIDVAAFQAASSALLKESGATWGWVDHEVGVVLGRMSDKGRLAYKDFERRPGPAPVAGPGPGG